MNDAERLFIEGMFKGSELSPESIAALGVKDPNQLDTLEEQAAQEPAQEPSQESSYQGEKPNEPVRVRNVLDSAKSTVVEIPSNVFSRTDIHPIALLAYLKSLYDDEWVEWLPETLWRAIRQDVGSISDVNKNKVQALSVALATDFPWKDWTTFENVGRAFNDTIPVFGQMQPLTPEETAFTIRTLRKIDSLRNIETVEFSDEVLGYIASVCLANGIVHAPFKWFGPVQVLIDAQNKTVETVPDFSTAWNAIEKTDSDLSDVEIDESNPVQVYVSRMLVIREYLQAKKELLKEQK